MLPDSRTSEDFSGVTLYVSEKIEPSEGQEAFHKIIDGSFSDWRKKMQCEDGRMNLDGCFEQVAEFDLSIDNWPNDPVARKPVSLRDCGDLDFGPEITAADWQAVIGPNKLPYVSSVYLYSINQVVISLDRKRAIVSLEYICGGLCGEGYSLLLENESGEWKVIGKQPHWVS